MTGVITIVMAKLRSHKLQTGMLIGSSFFLAFFGMSIVLLSFGLQSSFDASYKKLNAPNFCVSISETDIEGAELENFIRSLSYVNHYEIGRRYLVNHVESVNITMDFAYLAVLDNISKMPADGKVIINSAVHGSEAGDAVSFQINGKTAEFTVESVYVDPVNSAPENNIPYFYINEREITELTKNSGKGSFFVWMQLSVDNGQEQVFGNDFEAYFKKPFSGELYTMDDIRHSFLFRYDILKEFVVFIFLFFYTIVMIWTVFVSKMELESDKDNITAWKLMGFTEEKICLIYCIRSLLTAVFGSILGIALSVNVMTRWIGGIFAGLGTNVFSFCGLSVYGGSLFAAVCIVMTAAVWIPAMQGVRRVSENSVGKPFWQGRNGNLFFNNPGFLYVALGVQKSAAQITETILILFLSLSLGVLGMTSFYLTDGVAHADLHLEDWGIAELDIFVTRKENADERTSGLLDKLDEDDAVDYYYAALSDYVDCRIEKNGQTKHILGEIYDKEIPEKISCANLSGRNPENDREAAVGMNFARDNHIGIGDELVLLHNGMEWKLSVVGIYSSYKGYANSIRIITPDIQSFFENQAEGYYSIVLREGEDAGTYAGKLAENFDAFHFFPMDRNNTRFVKNLLYPLAFCVCLFLLIYLFLLILLKRWMCIVCRDEFILLYQMGMETGKVGKIVRWRFMIPVFAGAVAAIPLSLYVFPLWMRPLAQRLGLLKLPVYPDVRMVAAALLCILYAGFLSVCKTWKNNQERA